MFHEFTFRSADGKTDLHGAEWLPKGNVRAVLQISHGVAEYILRYAAFAQFMNDRGIAVVGHDHLGHGGSIAPDSVPLYFGGKGSWSWVVEDLYALRLLEGEKFPGLPYFILGHSMGSFLLRSYLIRYPGTVDGAIIMGTAWQPGVTLKAGEKLAVLEGKLHGERQPNRLLEKVVFGDCARAFPKGRTEVDWLSANEANVDRYLEDPLCGGTPTAGLFREMLGGMYFNQKAENLRKMDRNTPVLFVAGKDDPVGSMGKGVRQACEAFKKAGVRQVELKLYPGLRHEILNETCGAQVAEDLSHWLEQQL